MQRNKKRKKQRIGERRKLQCDAADLRGYRINTEVTSRKEIRHKDGSDVSARKITYDRKRQQRKRECNKLANERTVYGKAGKDIFSKIDQRQQHRCRGGGDVADHGRPSAKIRGGC